MGRRQFLSNQSKMALSKWYKITSVINLVPTTCLSRTFKCEPLNTLQHRQYSRYPSHYIEPVYELDKLEGLFQSEKLNKMPFCLSKLQGMTTTHQFSMMKSLANLSIP